MTFTCPTSFIFKKRPEVLKARGDGSTSNLYAEIAAGLMPPGVRIGRRAVAWPDYEIEAINRARMAGWSDDQIRDLVKRLVAARTEFAPIAFLSTTEPSE